MNISTFRSLLARFDQECPSGIVPFSAGSRTRAAQHNGLDAALETANAIFAGTPAGWVTGGLTALVGLAKIGVTAFLLPLPREGQHRFYGSGVKLILAGAAATLPGVGTYVNATLAAKDAADIVNYTTAPKNRLS